MLAAGCWRKAARPSHAVPWHAVCDRNVRPHLASVVIAALAIIAAVAASTRLRILLPVALLVVIVPLHKTEHNTLGKWAMPAGCSTFIRTGMDVTMHSTGSSYWLPGVGSCCRRSHFLQQLLSTPSL